MRTYRFYNGQRARCPSGPPSNPPAEYRPDLIRRVSPSIKGGGGGEILRDKGASALFKSTIDTPRSCIASRVASMYPAGILRFCPPGLAVALILGILSPLAHPSLQPSLAPCLLLSLFPTLSPFLPSSLRRGLPISTPSLFFLLGTSLRPHAGRDVTRPARGRIQTSAPSSFLNSLRPLNGQGLVRKKARRLQRLGALLDPSNDYSGDHSSFQHLNLRVHF